MIDLNWGDTQHNILIWTFSSPWSFEEFYGAKREAEVMIDSVEGWVDSIMFVAGGLTFPPAALWHLRKIVAHKHPRHRYVVLIGAKTLVPAILNVLAESIPGFGAQYHFATTQHEAIKLINTLRMRSN